jgi:hypothetical protein
VQIKEHRKTKTKTKNQTPKWNKEHYKKGDIWIKEDNTKHKRGVEQRYGKPKKKRIKQKSWK